MPPTWTTSPPSRTSPSPGEVIAAPNSKPVSGTGAGVSVTEDACAPSYPNDQARRPTSWIWNVSCSPGKACRVVWNDHVNLFQHASPAATQPPRSGSAWLATTALTEDPGPGPV